MLGSRTRQGEPSSTACSGLVLRKRTSRTPIREARSRSLQEAERSQVGQSCLWFARRSSRFMRRMERILGVEVRIVMPSFGGTTQLASISLPLISTRQSLQAP